jgi:hypothetical protein
MGKRYQHLTPWSADSMAISLPGIDTTAINEGLKLAYPQGLDMDVYKRNIKILEKTLALARNRGAEISIIFTPTLFGHWPGHELVLESLYSMQDRIAFAIFDYSNVFQQPELFSDHHHLNSKGISLLVKNYLKPDIQ